MPNNVVGYFYIEQVSLSISTSSTAYLSNKITSVDSIKTQGSQNYSFSLKTREDELTNYLPVNITSDLIKNWLLSSNDFELTNNALINSSYLSLLTFGKLNLIRSGTIRDGYGRDSSQFPLDVSGTNTIQTYKAYNAVPVYSLLKITSRNQVTSTNTLEISTVTEISSEDDFTLFDDNPMEITGKVPAPNSVLVDPEVEVQFRLLDESSGVDESSITVSVDGVLLVDEGDNQTGAFTLTKQVEILGPPRNSILYRYKPNTSFNSGKNIVVDVYAQDFASPVANITHEVYYFRCWSTGSITSQITIDPDIDYPYLDNVSPADGSIDVYQDSEISFSVLDDTTGVDLSTVVISINDLILFSNGVSQTPLSINYNSVNGGYNFTFSPNFVFGETIEVAVSASDLYSLDVHSSQETFSFTIISNDSIEITNFFLSNVGDNTLVVNTTEVTVDVIDNTYGISDTGTKIYLNTELVSPTFTPISGGYRLSFIPSNNFVQSDDIVVLVHAENLQVPSHPVFKEQTFKLSFGYRVFVYPTESYDYSKEIYQVIEASNTEGNTETFSSPYIFTTHAISSSSLEALIDTRKRYSDLGAFIAPVAPLFYYNKQIVVRVEATDLDGNTMEPFEFSFRVTSNPSEEENNGSS